MDERAPRHEGDAGAHDLRALPTRRRRTLITLGLLRAAATSAVLVALYYVLPLDRFSVSSLVLVLAVGLVGFGAMSYWEVRSIVRSRFPGIRGIQALATLVPFFLLLFSSTYFALSDREPSTFSENLSRTDALYFTVSTFATVGFGDIVARTDAVRLLVSGQILLDLVVLGLGIRVLLGAVQKGRSGGA
ncbi:potassium channel family protein [Promicromonospora sukumoe]|uniref:potassium channel family protein n=1 Tax=Promicromonospora sukumoe TaxID=88382 RepID=UPI0003A4E5EA|nr:potassium channel family protein [Promicromonospora sukumoe]